MDIVLYQMSFGKLLLCLLFSSPFLLLCRQVLNFSEVRLSYIFYRLSRFSPILSSWGFVCILHLDLWFTWVSFGESIRPISRFTFFACECQIVYLHLLKRDKCLDPLNNLCFFVLKISWLSLVGLFWALILSVDLFVFSFTNASEYDSCLTSFWVSRLVIFYLFLYHYHVLWFFFHTYFLKFDEMWDKKYNFESRNQAIEPFNLKFFLRLHSRNRQRKGIRLKERFLCAFYSLVSLVFGCSPPPGSHYPILTVKNQE